MSLLADDHTLPVNSRKRKQNQGPFFDDVNDSSDMSLSEDSDSAMGSDSEEDVNTGSLSNLNDSSSDSEDSDNSNPFCTKSENHWLSLMAEKKPKKQKLNPPKSKSSKLSSKPITSELISRASPTKFVTSPATTRDCEKDTVKSLEAVAEPKLVKMMTTTNIPTSSSHSAATVQQMKEELLKKLELLSSHLPANTLDRLIDELGGPGCVAEISAEEAEKWWNFQYNSALSMCLHAFWVSVGRVNSVKWD